jgi:hypothetical protein
MLEKLACKLGRNDEAPNIELAESLCKNKDTAGIGEIAGGLKGNDKAIANDCIKVLYEIGERNPSLIAEYADDFISLLSSKSNRLVWGGMTALSTIADLVPDIIYRKINIVLSAFHHGSVITVDNSVTVLAKLCRSNKVYKDRLFPLLLEHLQTCRPREVAQHAERISICVGKDDMKELFGILDMRRDYLLSSQKSRITKLENHLKKQNSITRISDARIR